MNSNGVLFTMMAIVLIVAVVSLLGLTQSARNDELKNSGFSNALDATSGKMANLVRDIVNQNKFGTNKTIDERSLPFRYDINGTRWTITQTLPVKNQVWVNYFDLINAFQVFVQDKDFTHAFDGLDVNASTIQNVEWGGTADRLRFMVLPQCLRYEVLYDANQLDIVRISGNPKESDCAGDFNIQNIQEMDVNIRISNAAEDFNLVTFDFNGAFDPLDQNPYFVVRVLDANCAGCNIPAPQKTITGHVRTNQPNRITVTCAGGSCKTSKNIALTLGVDSNAVHDGRQESVVFSWLFKQPVERFYLMDFNIATANPDFDITHRNR